MARVLILGSYAPSLVNFRGELLCVLRQYGHEVFACAPTADQGIIQQLEAWGVRYCNVKLDRTGLNPLKDLRGLYSLVRLFRWIRPDVILSYTIKPNIYGSIAARIASTPSRNALITGLGYTFMCGSAYQKLLNSIVSRLYQFALFQTQNVFFQNPDDQALFKKKSLVGDSTEQLVVNGSGVNLTHYAPSPLPVDPTFLLIARLIKEKGIYEYIEAARMIKKEYPGIRFYLVGWIDDAPSAILSSELSAWRREGLIEFLGRLEDVRPAITKCSIYVLPSYREGTPRTVLEAMAMGRAIITTDAPGCRQTVKPGCNGFLVPVRDVDALVKAMRYFIKHPEKIMVMGEQSILIAKKDYDVHKVNHLMLKKLGLC